MSRGRGVLRLKPVEADGYKFASASGAMQYQGLKDLAGSNLTATPSADGRLLVCEWGGGAEPKQTQAFVLAGKGRNKFGAKEVTIGGIKFGSGSEARHFADLVKQQAAGIIKDLEPHPYYEFFINGVRIGEYTADARYRVVASDELVVVDVKSEATVKARDWFLRKNLMRACFGITVREVGVAPRVRKRKPRHAA